MVQGFSTFSRLIKSGVDWNTIKDIKSQNPEKILPVN